MAEEPATDLRCPPGAGLPGEGLGVSGGLIAGNSPEALPAPMSWLEMPLRFGIGPSGRLPAGETPAVELPDAVGEAGAPETATVSAADGGVHFPVVVMMAVAVSVTEVTLVALAATGICALSEAGCLPDTELTTQLAAPSPLAQPLVNVAFWLDGDAVRATVTSDAEPLFSVETCTT
jgi:hypothetical protein